MASTLLKIGVVEECDINQFSENLQTFLHRMMPESCWGEVKPNNFRKVWYMEVMSNSESGYTIFLKTWRDPTRMLFSAVDAFFNTKHATLRCKRIDNSDS
jgi:hypothetical protein